MSQDDRPQVVIGADNLSKGFVAIRMAERQRGTELKAKTVHFEGQCPWLTCLLPNPHDHWICPKCKAVRFGNASCTTCRTVHKLAMRISGPGVQALNERVAGAEARLEAYKEREGDQDEPEQKE